MKLHAPLVILTLCSIGGVAQETLSEPEFADVFFRLDAGKLVSLERQTAAIQGKASGFIIMSTKAASEFPGTKSPVRFRSDQSLDFVVRTSSPMELNTTITMVVTARRLCESPLPFDALRRSSKKQDSEGNRSPASEARVLSMLSPLSASGAPR
jgi:hypothetical protein